MKVINIIYFPVVLIVLVLTSWLRFAPIQNHNFAFTYDQGRDIVEVRSIVAGMRPILVGPTTSINGVFLGPFYYYWNAIPFVIWRGDPAGLLYWQILWYQAAGLGLAWFFYKRNRVLGLISTVLFLLMPVGFYTSRYYWNANAMPAMTAWWLLYIWWALEKPSKWKWFGLGLVSGIGFQVDAALGVVFMPAAIAISIRHLTERNLRRSLDFARDDKITFSNYFKVKLWPLLIGFGITLLPQIAYELRKDFNMSKIFFDQVSGRNSILGASLPWGERLIDRYEAFSRLIHDTSHLHPSVAKVVAGFSLVFAIGWIVKSFRDPSKKTETRHPGLDPGSMMGILKKLSINLKTWFLNPTMDPGVRRDDAHGTDVETVKLIMITGLVLLGCAILLYLIFPQPLKVWYIDGLAVSITLIIAAVLTVLWMGKNTWKLPARIGIIALVVWTAISTWQAQKEFVLNSYLPSDNVSQLRNQIEVVNEVYRLAKGEGFTVYNYLPAVYDYAYNYIFWWYGARQYGYQPAKTTYADNVPEYIKSNEKLWAKKKEVSPESPVFLVVEPDKEFPDRREAWLSNFKEYCVIEKVILPWGTEVWKMSRQCEMAT